MRLIAEVLRDAYDLDPSPLITEAGIDERRLDLSGSRVSRRAVMRLWELAEAATGDYSIGLEVGSRLRPTTYHAMGVAFISADTLLEGLDLMCQYYRIVVTIPLELKLVDEGDDLVAFTVRYSDNGRTEAYRRHFDTPVVFGTHESALVLARAELIERLPGHSRDMFLAADSVLHGYLETLDPDEITARVRRELARLVRSPRTALRSRRISRARAKSAAARRKKECRRFAAPPSSSWPNSMCNAR